MARLGAMLIAGGLLLGLLGLPSLLLAAPAPFKLGYLAAPGSGLCLTAARLGLFRQQGVPVKLIRFTDPAQGLAALVAGDLAAGAFPVGPALQEIAAGKGLRIIAGGGVAARASGPARELRADAAPEHELAGIVVLIAPQLPATAKETLVRLTTALIRAQLLLEQQPKLLRQAVEKAGTPFIFDPNPNYGRLEQLWQGLGLQRPGMKRDFLARQVYEEIYCDALDRLVDADETRDPVLQRLFKNAVCVPDCCPTKSGKKATS